MKTAVALAFVNRRGRIECSVEIFEHETFAALRESVGQLHDDVRSIGGVVHCQCLVPIKAMEATHE